MRLGGPLLALLLVPAAAGNPGPSRACGARPDGARALLALHRYSAAAGHLAGSAAAPPATLDADQGDVAVLEDRGDIVVRRNPFDLDGAGLRLQPNPRGGYDPQPLAIPLEAPGEVLAVGGDGAQEVRLPFAFSFYGKKYTSAFCHSDGHVSFGRPDTASGELGLARFLSGPPRVAPFFADLDPSRGGSVSVHLLPDRAVFLWSDVPGAGQLNHNSFELALHPDGSIEMVWGAMESREGIVGVTPGGTLEVTAADLSAGGPVGSAGALIERFSETEHVDLVSVARRFYASHPDLFDQLVVYTTRPLNPAAGTLAFELNVKNDVGGIGLDRFDATGEWGSAGRLSSIVFMDSIDPYLELDGFEILGHEVAHRWGAYLRFLDGTGTASTALLGRGESHWSFFLDSDASDLEGNDIADEGGGRFETVDFARGYSALDQYAMGLRGPDEVAPFFYVAEPDNFRPNRPYKASSGPEAGVSFTGLRREVRIEDVVAALGPRVPDAAHASHLERLAFLLVADATAPATPKRTGAVSRIRGRFEGYFRAASGGRGTVDTSLP